ncbi:hypothetical protein AHAS_Ahas03G0165400 [Arachis hypogaea]
MHLITIMLGNQEGLQPKTCQFLLGWDLEAQSTLTTSKINLVPYYQVQLVALSPAPDERCSSVHHVWATSDLRSSLQNAAKLPSHQRGHCRVTWSQHHLRRSVAVPPSCKEQGGSLSHQECAAAAACQ